ncbi:hypothetical protein BH20ACT23_BH20ACT23_01990 [soil metagenome]
MTDAQEYISVRAVARIKEVRLAMEEHPASSIRRDSIGSRTRGEAELDASAGNDPSLCPSEQRAVRRWALILICALIASLATAVLVAYVESFVTWAAFGVFLFIFITAAAGSRAWHRQRFELGSS